MLIHIVCMETYDLHGLILCVSEGLLSVLLCFHNGDIETFSPHVWTQCVSGGHLSLQLYIHIENTGDL